MSTESKTEEERQKELQKKYYDLSTGFSSAYKFYQRMKHKGYTYRQIKDFVRLQKVNQLAQKPEKAIHHPIWSTTLGSWQLDLTFLPKLKK